ncbi:uncharacterized protein [Nicotiana sylvestris]|uniref:uncharacterized protein n=1 Tax=Nicotiana sylvestris TaxID=4096 RepID=UPI00388C9D4F
MAVLRETVLQGSAKEVSIDEDGVLQLQGVRCVPNVYGLGERILEEWMKKDIVEYVARCLNCQQVKYENQRPGGLIQQMTIPEWKWERITMEFVVGLSRTLQKINVVWAIVDRGQWDQFLPLVEFASNKSYQSSIEMAPFEALYGRRCRFPIGSFDPGEAKLYSTDLVKDALEKVKLIQKRLRIAQSRQKSYADQKMRDVSFMVGEKPIRGSSNFSRVYALEIRRRLVSYVRLQLDENLGYEEDPIAIVARPDRQLRSKRISTVKV